MPPKRTTKKQKEVVPQSETVYVPLGDTRKRKNPEIILSGSVSPKKRSKECDPSKGDLQEPIEEKNKNVNKDVLRALLKLPEPDNKITNPSLSVEWDSFLVDTIKKLESDNKVLAGESVLNAILCLKKKAKQQLESLSSWNLTNSSIKIIMSSFLVLSKAYPDLFQSDSILSELLIMLRTDSSSSNTKSRLFTLNNSVLSIFAANVIYLSHRNTPNWPAFFITAFLNDTDRIWTYNSQCVEFVTRLSAGFSTRFPHYEIYLSMIKYYKSHYHQQQQDLDFSNISEEDKYISNIFQHYALIQSKANVKNNFYNDTEYLETETYKAIKYAILSFFEKEKTSQSVSSRQLNSSGFISKTSNEFQNMNGRNSQIVILLACGVPEIRLLASEYMEGWLNNSKVSNFALGIFLTILCSCNFKQNQIDYECLSNLLKMKITNSDALTFVTNGIANLVCSLEAEYMVNILHMIILNDLSLLLSSTAFNLQKDISLSQLTIRIFTTIFDSNLYILQNCFPYIWHYLLVRENCVDLMQDKVLLNFFLKISSHVNFELVSFTLASVSIMNESYNNCGDMDSEISPYGLDDVKIAFIGRFVSQIISSVILKTINTINQFTTTENDHQATTTKSTSSEIILKNFLNVENPIWNLIPKVQTELLKLLCFFVSRSCDSDKLKKQNIISAIGAIFFSNDMYNCSFLHISDELRRRNNYSLALDICSFSVLLVTTDAFHNLVSIVEKIKEPSFQLVDIMNLIIDKILLIVSKSTFSEWIINQEIMQRFGLWIMESEFTETLRKQTNDFIINISSNCSDSVENSIEFSATSYSLYWKFVRLCIKLMLCFPNSFGTHIFSSIGGGLKKIIFNFLSGKYDDNTLKKETCQLSSSKKISSSIKIINKTELTHILEENTLVKKEPYSDELLNEQGEESIDNVNHQLSNTKEIFLIPCEILDETIEPDSYETENLSKMEQLYSIKTIICKCSNPDYLSDYLNQLCTAGNITNMDDFHSTLSFLPQLIETQGDMSQVNPIALTYYILFDYDKRNDEKTKISHEVLINTIRKDINPTIISYLDFILNSLRNFHLPIKTKLFELVCSFVKPENNQKSITYISSTIIHGDFSFIRTLINFHADAPLILSGSIVTLLRTSIQPVFMINIFQILTFVLENCDFSTRTIIFHEIVYLFYDKPKILTTLLKYPSKHLKTLWNKILGIVNEEIKGILNNNYNNHTQQQTILCEELFYRLNRSSFGFESFSGVMDNIHDKFLKYFNRVIQFVCVLISVDESSLMSISFAKELLFNFEQFLDHIINNYVSSIILSLLDNLISCKSLMELCACDFTTKYVIKLIELNENSEIRKLDQLVHILQVTNPKNEEAINHIVSYCEEKFDKILYDFENQSSNYKSDASEVVFNLYQIFEFSFHFGSKEISMNIVNRMIHFLNIYHPSQQRNNLLTDKDDWSDIDLFIKKLHKCKESNTFSELSHAIFPESKRSFQTVDYSFDLSKELPIQEIDMFKKEQKEVFDDNFDNFSTLTNFKRHSTNVSTSSLSHLNTFIKDQKLPNHFKEVEDEDQHLVEDHQKFSESQSLEDVLNCMCQNSLNDFDNGNHAIVPRELLEKLFNKVEFFCILNHSKNLDFTNLIFNSMIHIPLEDFIISDLNIENIILFYDTLIFKANLFPDPDVSYEIKINCIMKNIMKFVNNSSNRLDRFSVISHLYSTKLKIHHQTYYDQFFEEFLCFIYKNTNGDGFNFIPTLSELSLPNINLSSHDETEEGDDNCLFYRDIFGYDKYCDLIASAHLFYIFFLNLFKEPQNTSNGFEDSLESSIIERLKYWEYIFKILPSRVIINISQFILENLRITDRQLLKKVALFLVINMSTDALVCYKRHSDCNLKQYFVSKFFFMDFRSIKEDKIDCLDFKNDIFDNLIESIFSRECQLQISTIKFISGNIICVYDRKITCAINNISHLFSDLPTYSEDFILNEDDGLLLSFVNSVKSSPLKYIRHCWYLIPQLSSGLRSFYSRYRRFFSSQDLSLGKNNTPNDIYCWAQVKQVFLENKQNEMNRIFQVLHQWETYNIYLKILIQIISHFMKFTFEDSRLYGSLRDLRFTCTKFQSVIQTNLMDDSIAKRKKSRKLLPSYQPVNLFIENTMNYQDGLSLSSSTIMDISCFDMCFWLLNLYQNSIFDYSNHLNSLGEATFLFTKNCIQKNRGTKLINLLTGINPLLIPLTKEYYQRIHNLISKQAINGEINFIEAYERRFPFTPHIPTFVGSEILSENKSVDGAFHEIRRRCKVAISVPFLLKKIVGVDHLFFIQINTLDLKNRILTIEARNESFSNRVAVKEICHYQVHPDNSSWTIFNQKAQMDMLNFYGFENLVEKIGMKTYKSAIKKAKEVLPLFIAELAKEGITHVPIFQPSKYTIISASITSELDEQLSTDGKSKSHSEEIVNDFSNLSLIEENCFKMLKERLEGRLVESDIDDVDMLRFLRANKMNFIKAHESIINYIKWRKQINLVSIVEDWKLSESLFPYYRGCWHYHDNDKNPVYFIQLGQMDLKGIFKCIGPNGFIKQILCINEQTISKLREQKYTKQERLNRSCTWLVDLEGLTMRHTWRPVLKTILKIVEICEIYYPDILGKMIMANAPKIFGIIWTLIHAFINDDSKDKFRVFSKNEIIADPTILHKYFPLEYIPKCFKGTCEVDIEQLDDFIVPVSLYLTQYSCQQPNFQTFSTLEENYKIANVSKGHPLTIQIYIDEPDTVISWDFDVLEGSVKFDITVKKSSEKIEKLQRVSSANFETQTHDEGSCVQGTFVCGTSENYTISWKLNDSNDMAKTKSTILYFYELLPPQHFRKSLLSLKSSLSDSSKMSDFDFDNSYHKKNS